MDVIFTPPNQVVKRVPRKDLPRQATAAGEPRSAPKPGTAISPTSVRSPNDQEATYRTKGGVAYEGYVANLTETCDPDNPFQLIILTQTAPNITDDTTLLREASPTLTERTTVDTIHTDGGYGGPDSTPTCARTTSCRSKPPFAAWPPIPTGSTLADFEPTVTDERDDPFNLSPRADRRPGPRSQTRPLHRPLRVSARLSVARALPDAGPADRARRSLRVQSADLDLAQRRRMARAARAEPGNPRAAVEATVAALKRPFADDQLPVRGRSRMDHLIVVHPHGQSPADSSPPESES